MSKKVNGCEQVKAILVELTYIANYFYRKTLSKKANEHENKVKAILGEGVLHLDVFL